MDAVKTRREESVEATRDALLDSAEDLFTTHGFAATSLDDVASAARVTKGALYHHFPGGKQALFRAVFDRIDQTLADRIAAALPTEGTGWDCVVAGIDSYLEACKDPAVRIVIFQEGPVALGYEAWCELDDCPSRALLHAALELLVSAGEIRPHPVDLLTQVLFGTLGQAGRWMAAADDVDVALAHARLLVLEMLGALRT